MRLLTPWGVGGVAVVAAGNADERRRLAGMLRRRGAPVELVPGRPAMCTLMLDDVAVDQVLALDRGAAGLEVHMHGSPVVVEAIGLRCGQSAPAPASAAARLLRDALSEAQLRLALEQSALDFAAFVDGLACLRQPKRDHARDAALERSRVAMALAQPQPLVLVGGQNAGKSTLMNRLLFRERVLTGPLPGLTRDPVAETVALSGYPYTIIDTAGAGAAASAVDRLAQDRARAARLACDQVLVVLVIDGAVGPVGEDLRLCRPGTVVVRTKADLPQASWPTSLPCHLELSCVHLPAPEVRRQVGEALRGARRLPEAGPVGGPAALDQSGLARLRSL